MWASLAPVTSMPNEDRISAMPHSQVYSEDQTDGPDSTAVGKPMERVRQVSLMAAGGPRTKPGHRAAGSEQRELTKDRFPRVSPGQRSSMSPIQPGAVPTALLSFIPRGQHYRIWHSFLHSSAPFLLEGTGQGEAGRCTPGQSFFSAALGEAVLVGVTPSREEDDSLGYRTCDTGSTEGGCPNSPQGE